MLHELVEGSRYPAFQFEDQRSVYEMVCKCGKALSAYSWDAALDAYLEHYDEAAAQGAA